MRSFKVFDKMLQYCGDSDDDDYYYYYYAPGSILKNETWVSILR